MEKEFVNGSLWTDAEGNELHAHGGYIIKFNDYYYWYGEDRRKHYYVSCYRSKDLSSWEFRNHILTTDSQMAEYRVRTKLQLISNTGEKVNIERPKVIYNKITRKFVMWAHFENGIDYNDAAIAIATCDTPDGNFIYHGSFRPYGYMSRDCTLFIDENDAYFISASRDNADLHIYRLSQDYLNVESLLHKLWQGEYREAPAVFKAGNEYIMLSSFCTGWAPNQSKYAVAKEINGVWSDLMDIGDETTFNSQPAFILPYKDQLLYFGDRWGGEAENYFKSGYVVYPLVKEGSRWVLGEAQGFKVTEKGFVFN